MLVGDDLGQCSCCNITFLFYNAESFQNSHGLLLDIDESEGGVAGDLLGDALDLVHIVKREGGWRAVKPWEDVSSLFLALPSLPHTVEVSVRRF